MIKTDSEGFMNVWKELIIVSFISLGIAVGLLTGMFFLFYTWYILSF